MGDEVTIGDWVAYSAHEYTNLQVGRITKFNKNSVTLKNKSGKMVIGKTPNQIIKISKERAVLLMLEM